ncbi:response regulator [Maribacter sp. R77961]|uniref:response regulator n=1 Tax=Maribacter sp. R77961 TaxID=3093871 RepID=UPI0037CB631D
MNYKLFLVEDDEVFTFLLEKEIKKTGLLGTIDTFINGLAALERLKKEYSSEKDYVIFLDLNMPVMNGWEFLKEISTFANPDNCIVFILTTSNYYVELNELNENPFVLSTISKPITTTIMKGVKEKIELKLKGKFAE